MSVINNPVSLAPGPSIKLTNRSQVTASGQSLQFTVPKRPDGGEFSLALQIVGNPVGLTSQLQADFTSGGLGTNLVSYGGAGPTTTGITVIGTAASTPIVAGGLYALNITGLTSGNFDVWAVINKFSNASPARSHLSWRLLPAAQALADDRGFVCLVI